MKKIDQRRIALAIVTFICTIACAQVPGDYISTHFKKGDTLQYTYKLSIKAEDPTMRIYHHLTIYSMKIENPTNQHLH